MAKLNMVQALNQALSVELENDKRVVICGEDVGHNGGVFRVTEGLQAKYGANRVFDTPLAESGIMGTSIGMALYGLRPVTEMQFAGFTFVAFNQLLSQATKMRYRSGGNFTVPIVLRAPFGGGVRTPELHSDNIESFLMHMQGIKVLIPSNPYDAKGMLHAALDDPDPVFLLEHMKLYRSMRQEVPEERYTVPIGKAATVQEGSDITIVAYGAMVHTAQKAAEAVAKSHDASVELIDLRSIVPMDVETILASVRKTGRLLIVSEAPKSASVASEISALVNEKCLYSLLAPVKRVTCPDTPYPVPSVEDQIIPSVERVAKGILEVLEV